MTLTCHKCRKELELSANQNIPRSQTCPSCGSDMRCCMMCVFYDQSSYNECREPTAERVLEKDKANFCDFFKMGRTGQNQDNKENLLAAANALFKK